MIDLDHVALGLPDVQPVLDVLVGELGGTVIYGGDAPGCRYVTTRLGDGRSGMNLELLQPDGEDPFLVRFLERDGLGPHHLTFIADDVVRLLERLAAAGLRPVVERLGDPQWREAFFAPDAVGGTVVQIADTTNARPHAEAVAAARVDEELGAQAVERRGWASHQHGWWAWPGPRASTSVVLERVVLSATDLDAALALYAGVLGGEVAEHSTGALELTWQGGGRLRFEHDAERVPGVLRLECAGLAAPRELGGARLVPAPG